MGCSKTVPKPYLSWLLGLALSEKQIPQIEANSSHGQENVRRATFSYNTVQQDPALPICLTTQKACGRVAPLGGTPL